MAYLIDGNNFLGQISSSYLRDSGSKYGLILKLLTFQRLKRTRILIVFDGPPDPNLTDERLRRKKFSIIYPSYGQDADFLIKELILKQRDRKKFIVVSSDHEIKDYAKSKGVKTLSSKDFHSQLKKILKESRKAKEMEKKTISSSPLEIKLWLELFDQKR